VINTLVMIYSPLVLLITDRLAFFTRQVAQDDTRVVTAHVMEMACGFFAAGVRSKVAQDALGRAASNHPVVVGVVRRRRHVKTTEGREWCLFHTCLVMDKDEPMIRAFLHHQAVFLKHGFYQLPVFWCEARLHVHTPGLLLAPKAGVAQRLVNSVIKRSHGCHPLVNVFQPQTNAVSLRSRGGNKRLRRKGKDTGRRCHVSVMQVLFQGE